MHTFLVYIVFVPVGIVIGSWLGLKGMRWQWKHRYF